MNAIVYYEIVRLLLQTDKSKILDLIPKIVSQ